MTNDLPMTPAELTPSWLNAALGDEWLQRHGPITRVETEWLATQGLFTQLIRLHLVSSGQAEHGGLPPTTLIAKLSSTDSQTVKHYARFYRREVEFYEHLAPELGDLVPRCFFASYDPTTHAHVLLLEDLAPSIAGRIEAPVTVDEAHIVAKQLARVHAHWLGAPSLGTLQADFPIHGPRFAAGYERQLDAGLTLLAPYLEDETPALAAALVDGLQSRWDRQFAEPGTFIHWDAHAGNVLFAKDGGRFALIDWQNCTVGRGMWDLVRFCVLSLSPADRRHAERSIVHTYANAMGEHAKPDQSADALWEEYLTLVPLCFAQQLRFFASIDTWDATRQSWRHAVAPRVIAALHDALR